MIEIWLWTMHHGLLKFVNVCVIVNYPPKVKNNPQLISLCFQTTFLITIVRLNIHVCIHLGFSFLLHDLHMLNLCD